MNARKAGTNLVLDTSVVAKWFLPEPLSPEADKILEDLRQRKSIVAAPDLVVYEFANILWQRQKKGEISTRQASAIMSDFERLPLELVPGDAIGAQALDIAGKAGCTAYDGAFIALAVELEYMLVTADQRLVRLMAGTRFAKSIVWLGDLTLPTPR